MKTFAVIEISGHQYFVRSKDRLSVLMTESYSSSPDIKINNVLFVGGEPSKIGTPYVSGASVMAKVVGLKKGKKVVVLRYHPKTRYRRKKGFQARITELEIIKIE